LFDVVLVIFSLSRFLNLNSFGEIIMSLQSVSQSVSRPATLAPLATARSARSETPSRQTYKPESDAPQGRTSSALSLPGRSGLGGAKTALGALALVAQPGVADALSNEGVFQLTFGLSFGIPVALGAISAVVNMDCSHFVSGIFIGIPLTVMSELSVCAARSTCDEPTGSARQLLPTARQATEAASNAASTLISAAKNNPGTAAAVAVTVAALTTGAAAYATRKPSAEPTPDSARQALTADHAV
jgi:hypothetical protein